MKFALAAAFISAVVSAVQAQSEPAAAAHLQHHACRYPTVPLLRAYNPSATDYFYTTNTTEMQNAVTHLGYLQEGNAATIHPEQTPITIPLYRLYSPDASDHVYTTEAYERIIAGENGYVEEGVTGYVYEVPLCGTVPLYRMYSPKGTDHFYTTSAEERDTAVESLGYTDEGITAYVNPQA
ncbi:hypothetical protein LXA43DRAFT_1067087 [Ganoderma leucocontextum]|nr:hypothetical protein LXA43DRAFT_1067087 [Ganoderma leucocontextum]